MYTQSDTIALLAAGLLTFHKEVGKIKKKSDNPFFKSKYASLSAILDVIDEPLTTAELVVTQFPDESGLVTQLTHISGEWMRSTYVIAPKEANNPQALGSTITYGRRYAVSAILSLNIEEDDDGNAASPIPPKRATQPHSVPQLPLTPIDTSEPVTITITGVRSGEKDGKTWEAAILDDDTRLFNNTNPMVPMEKGTHTVLLSPNGKGIAKFL